MWNTTLVGASTILGEVWGFVLWSDLKSFSWLVATCQMLPKLLLICNSYWDVCCHQFHNELIFSMKWDCHICICFHSIYIHLTLNILLFLSVLSVSPCNTFHFLLLFKISTYYTSCTGCYGWLLFFHRATLPPAGQHIYKQEPSTFKKTGFVLHNDTVIAFLTNRYYNTYITFIYWGMWNKNSFFLK